MGKRGPTALVFDNFRFWFLQWERCFRYLRDGLSESTKEVLDPDTMRLKREQVGPNHYRIEPVKTLHPFEPTGALRLGRDGRLRRKWSEVPKSETQNIDFEFPNITIRLPSIPPDGEIFSRLVQAKTVRQVRILCTRSRYWQPIKPERCRFLLEIQSRDERARAIRRLQNMAGLVFPRLQELHKHADEFLAAKAGPRFPRSSRPTSTERRLRFIACAMAGITLNRSPRTAIDLFGRIQSGVTIPSQKEGQHGVDPSIEFKTDEYFRIK